jgi:outer membrane protein TolC
MIRELKANFIRRILTRAGNWTFLGGVRRSVEAAQASLEATQEDLYNVLVSLLAEVALNYPIQFQVDAK